MLPTVILPMCWLVSHGFAVVTKVTTKASHRDAWSRIPTSHLGCLFTDLTKHITRKHFQALHDGALQRSSNLSVLFLSGFKVDMPGCAQLISSWMQRRVGNQGIYSQLSA
jgi:hypothetical protein